jgi:hypothetical protein
LVNQSRYVSRKDVVGRLIDCGSVLFTENLHGRRQLCGKARIGAFDAPD